MDLLTRLPGIAQLLERVDVVWEAVQATFFSLAVAASTVLGNLQPVEPTYSSVPPVFAKVSAIDKVNESIHIAETRLSTVQEFCWIGTGEGKKSKVVVKLVTEEVVYPNSLKAI